MQIRKFTSSDLDAGLALCRASNWNQLAEDWLCFTEHKGGRVWLAESEGAVAGSIAMLDYGEFTWLAMMLVALARALRHSPNRSAAACWNAM